MQAPLPRQGCDPLRGIIIKPVIVVTVQSLSHVLLLCNPVNCSPPGFSVHEISQAGILEWVAISFFRESSQPRYQTCISCIEGGVFSPEQPEKPTPVVISHSLIQRSSFKRQLWTSIQNFIRLSAFITKTSSHCFFQPILNTAKKRYLLKVQLKSYYSYAYIFDNFSLQLK